MTGENIDQKTSELVNALKFDDPAAEAAVTDWFRMFPESLYRVAAAGLTAKAGPFVHRLIAEDADCCTHLCDPALLDGPTAARLARSLQFANPRLDIRLTHAAIEWAAIGGYEKHMRQCLGILEEMGSGSRINSALVQLLKCSNPAVRSKVVDILIRSSANAANIREWLRDPDPRIRANVLESLSEVGREGKWIQQILLDNLNDPHGRAAANAAIGLHRLGVEAPAVAKLCEMATNGDPIIRCSAAWAMGQVPNVKLFECLNKLRTDANERVRWHALKSLGHFNRAGVKPKPAEVSGKPDRVCENTPVPHAPPAPQVRGRSVPGVNTRTFGQL
jgi:hypothetical protein